MDGGSVDDREVRQYFQASQGPAALVGHAKGSVTSKYIHTLDTAIIMAADTISSYIQGLLDGIEFKQTAYALDRDSRKAALARLPKEGFGHRFRGRRRRASIGCLGHTLRTIMVGCHPV
jgi:hypothetical protein